MKYKKRPPFKRSNSHRNNNDSFGNGSFNNSSRVTGSLTTVLEKYKNLAKDATSSGDYVGAENYLQHAEHYGRMINERNERSNGINNVASIKNDDKKADPSTDKVADKVADKVKDSNDGTKVADEETAIN